MTVEKKIVQTIHQRARPTLLFFFAAEIIGCGKVSNELISTSPFRVVVLLG
jgi:hypothetical protein